MMKEIFGFWFVIILLLTTPARSKAEPQTKMPKIGLLSLTSVPLSAPSDSLLRELRPLGYVQGQNIAIEFRSANGKLERLPALAEELVGLKVDVLVVSTTPGALAAKNAAKTIPIVFYRVSDPIAVGLIDSLARPGGNITGVTDIAAVLAGKRLEILKETVPKLSRVAVLWNPQETSATQDWKESQLLAPALGLQLHSMAVSSAERYESAFQEAIKAGSAALAVTSHTLAGSNQKQVDQLAKKYRLPAIYWRGDFVAMGSLMSYGPAEAEPIQRVAVFVDKILKGTKPADIPVEQPKRFEFIVNLKSAKQIGLTIPPNVLARADRVIR
jgi:putative tryptophan/tyrosine transport system substrate-binding protein